MSVPVRSPCDPRCFGRCCRRLLFMRLRWFGVALRDLAQSCKAPLGEGFLSSVGYLLWMAAAAIALFAASTRQIQGSVLNRQFAFCGGGFSLWLCLDDMFLVHDRYLGEASSTSPTPSSPGCCCFASEVPSGASVVTLFWPPLCCWACRF